MNLSEIDYLNGVPKCIQYANQVSKEDYSNPFYLYPDSAKDGNVVGSVYYIIGGRWELVIKSYDPSTKILTGIPKLYPNMEPMEFKAIPIEEGIKHRYVDGLTDRDADNLRELESLGNNIGAHMKRVDSIDGIAKHLKSQVKRYRKKIENGYKMNENLTKWGGFRVGYNHAKLDAFENLLDMIYGNDSWEKELN